MGFGSEHVAITLHKEKCKVFSPDPISAASPQARNKAIHKVAADFESLILGEVFRTMRSTVTTSEAEESSFSKDMFTSMMDEAFAKEAAGNGQFGLAKVIARQLGAEDSLGKGVPTAVHQRLNDGSWVQPVATRGLDVHPAQSFGAYRPGLRPEQCDGGHCGVDLAHAEGTPVAAANSGTITALGKDPASQAGLWVGIRHPGSIETRYLHLSSLASDLAVGTSVHAGQVIGHVGNTGTSSHGAHLHFELRHVGQEGKHSFVDTEPYLDAWKARPQGLRGPDDGGDEGVSFQKFRGKPGGTR